jgi:hypothetical protein
MHTADEAVAAGMHVLLLVGVAHGVALAGTRAAEGVVAPAGVGHDGQKCVSEI